LANSVVDSSAIRKLEAHYRFLSAFVHPYTNVASLLYGRNVWNWPAYDHYSSKLALLYVVVLAVEELRAFVAMSRRPPLVGIDGVNEITALCDEAWQASSRLWFQGRNPNHTIGIMKRIVGTPELTLGTMTSPLWIRTRCPRVKSATTLICCSG
jgi:hypothetical protein